jgi:phage terminase large subunit-like protein
MLAERRSIFADLASVLENDGQSIARPEQLPPPGDWSIHLILAGRGWGKTRTGAEWVRGLAESGAVERIALVGPTAADCRDTMVEGVSGLLSIAPNGNRPIYEPSKRRLTWPNGVQASMFSSEEPERLRGPAHSAAWCFIAGTRVATALGDVRIETVRAGDLVQTRSGFRRVVGVSSRDCLVGRVTFDDGRELIGTADHPIAVADGWERLDGLQAGDLACAIVASSRAVSVASTWRPVGRQSVFCLKVDGAPEYFANGILVHNCDELGAWRNVNETWTQLQFGLRLGKRPRQVVTTTPKPIKLLKALLARADCVVTRGSTYANAENLAPSFISAITQQYEGTRLGRQELNAELLEDVPGALWTRDLLELCRVEKAAPLKRIVVAIDPAVSVSESSDETGIVVAGLGVDNHGYVLEDASGKFSPIDWARRAVALCRKWGADRVIAEANQGGLMVEQTVRTVETNVSFRAVHASRGKITRAEPIAALFEQQRIHLVGSFALLEDQLCSFAAGSSGSPDRLDAMCWGFSDLMVTNNNTGFLEYFRQEVENSERDADTLCTTQAGWRRWWDPA